MACLGSHFHLTIFSSAIAGEVICPFNLKLTLAQEADRELSPSCRGRLSDIFNRNHVSRDLPVINTVSGQLYICNQ